MLYFENSKKKSTSWCERFVLPLRKAAETRSSTSHGVSVGRATFGCWEGVATATTCVPASVPSDTQAQLLARVFATCNSLCSMQRKSPSPQQKLAGGTALSGIRKRRQREHSSCHQGISASDFLKEPNFFQQTEDFSVQNAKAKRKRKIRNLSAGLQLKKFTIPQPLPKLKLREKKPQVCWQNQNEHAEKNRLTTNFAGMSFFLLHSSLSWSQKMHFTKLMEVRWFGVCLQVSALDPFAPRNTMDKT